MKALQVEWIQDRISGPKGKVEDLDQISTEFEKSQKKSNKKEEMWNIMEINKPSNYRHRQGIRILSQ